MATLGELEARMEDLEIAVLGIWLLLHGINITFMQAGFALLELGSVRSKHAKSILFKNVADMGISTLAWYLVGFGIAGEGASGSIGNDYAVRDTANFLAWFHSFSFAVTAATIVSGAVAERMTLPAYLVESFILVSFLYAIIVRWCWDADGFLAEDWGYVDFAGSGVVHLTGGVAALTACIIVGPRTLRFQVERDESGRAIVKVADFRGHSPSMSNLGVYILLVGWISFNSSSTLSVSAVDLELAGRAAVNTVVAASSTMATLLLYQIVIVGSCDLPAAHNAILAGLVAITAPCAYVTPWAAVIIGAIAFPVYKFASVTLIALTIDDPLDAFAVHGANGLWGVISVAFFAKGDLLRTHFAFDSHDDNHKGFLDGGDASLLVGQLLGATVIIATVAAPTAFLLTIFHAIKRPGGGSLLRVDQDTELLGLDFKYHEGSAYPELTKEDVEFHNLAQEAERRARARGGKEKVNRQKTVVNEEGTCCWGLCSTHWAVQKGRLDRASSEELAEEFEYQNSSGTPIVSVQTGRALDTSLRQASGASGDSKHTS